MGKKKKQLKRHRSRKAPKVPESVLEKPGCYWKDPPPDMGMPTLWRWCRNDLVADDPKFGFEEAVAALKPRITKAIKEGKWAEVIQAARALRGMRDFEMRKFVADREALNRFMESYVTARLVAAQVAANTPEKPATGAVTNTDMNKQLHDILRTIAGMSGAEKKRLLEEG